VTWSRSSQSQPTTNPFIVKQESPIHGVASINPIQENSINSIDSVTASVISNIMPKPMFSGSPNDWICFYREWELWWSIQRLPLQYKSLVLVSCLPLQDQSSYRQSITLRQLNFKGLLQLLKSRYEVDNKASKRLEWYSLRCPQAELASYTKFIEQWTNLYMQVTDHSPEEDSVTQWYDKNISKDYLKVILYTY
jgi:hypothetical protein